MYWEKVFGKDMLTRIDEYIRDRKMTITALVRFSVEEYLSGKGY